MFLIGKQLTSQHKFWNWLCILCSVAFGIWFLNFPTHVQQKGINMEETDLSAFYDPYLGMALTLQLTCHCQSQTTLPTAPKGKKCHLCVWEELGTGLGKQLESSRNEMHFFAHIFSTDRTYSLSNRELCKISSSFWTDHGNQSL